MEIPLAARDEGHALNQPLARSKEDLKELRCYSAASMIMRLLFAKTTSHGTATVKLQLDFAREFFGQLHRQHAEV